MENMTSMEKKIAYVKALSDIIVEVQGNVTGIEYEVYKNTDNGEVEEILVIHYDGGAISARNCGGDSYSAIFREISTKLDSGYYGELQWYNEIVNSPIYERIYK